MSRILVLGSDNRRLGEIRATCSRGYGLLDAHTGGGMSTTISISEVDALQPFMRLGRMIYIEGGKLPPYAGVLDTPWAAKSPVQVTCYNADYLLTMRSPEMAGKAVGVDGLLAEANALGDLGIRLGNMDVESPPGDVILSRTNFYDQLKTYIKRANLKATTRPEIDETGRLLVYFDLTDDAGMDTKFLLHDGLNANMSITDARIDGAIYNRVLAANSKQPPVDAPAQTDDESAAEFGLRNRFVQIAGVDDISQLLAGAQAALAVSAYPSLIIDAQIIDIDETWRNVRPGNLIMVHAANIYLPGWKGYRGKMAVRSMHFDEPNNTLTAQLETSYAG